MMKTSVSIMRPVKLITRSGILAAVAVGLALSLRFPLLPAAPFLVYEPSDVPLLIGAFLLGPAWAGGIALVTAIVLGLIGGGGIIGGISRFAGSAALGVTAGWAYRKLAGRKYRALTSVTLGVTAYILIEILMALLLGPLFFGSMKAAAATIVPIILPFNLLKGSINGSISLMTWALLHRRKSPEAGR